MTTNEDFNLFAPDQISATVGWKQFIMNWQFDVGYQFTRFFNDDDRSRAHNRNSVFVEASQDLWYAAGRRLELGVRFRHDFPDNRNTGFILLTWHFGNGRGYRDFWPGEVNFRSLKRELIPVEHDNVITDGKQ